MLSAFNSGRGPNSSSLPFQNAGYAINNGGLRDYEGNHLGVGVTVEDVAPGTTVEELMARDAE